jgi:PAS domain S-box-containing protein
MAVATPSKPIRPWRDALVAGLVVAVAVCLGGAVVYERARYEKMADVRRHIAEQARRMASIFSSGRPGPKVDVDDLRALTEQVDPRLKFVRDNAAEVRRAYLFALDEEETLTRIDTGLRNEQPGPRPIPDQALRARKHYQETARDPAQPEWLVFDGPEATAFYLVKGRTPAGDSALAIEADTEQLLIGLNTIRHALWFTALVGVVVGGGIGFAVWRMRHRAAVVQNQLAESRKLEEAVISSLGAVIYTYDPATDGLQWRGSAVALLGAVPENGGESRADWIARIHPEDRAPYAAALAAAIENLVPMELEYRVKNADDSMLWVLDRNRPMKRRDGGGSHLVGSLVDLTERREAEDALRLFFDETAMAHLAFDGDTLVDANPAALALFAADDKTALLAQPAWALWPRRQPTHALSAEAWADHVMATMSKGASRFEWQFRRLDGALVECDVFLRHAVFQDRDVLMMGCTDVTQTKRARAQLVESEQRFRDVSEAIGEFIWEVDRDSRYTYASRRVLEVFGLEPEAVLGRTPFEFVPEEDLAALRERSTAILSRGVPFRNFEHRVKRADGAVLWISVSGRPTFNSSGEIVGFRGASLDITEHRAREEELVLQKEAAEAAGRAKGSFLAMMSHEIRTPLNSVLGFADLVLETPLTPTQRDYLETIKSSGDALLTLLNDILDFSKIESGQMEVEIRPTSLSRCIDEVIGLYRPGAAAKKLSLTADIDSNVPSVVLTDASRLRQILLNLVGNAVKFTADGSVRVHAFLEPALRPEDPGRIRIEVSDTGIGVSGVQRERLFKPFSQADSSTTRRFGGTGLGLAISQRLATLLDGKLGLLEQPGPGATFFVEIPARVPPEAKTNEPARDASDPLIGLRPGVRAPVVLVVDDNTLNRRLTSKLLHMLGAETDTAHSAVECFEKIASRRYDLVLMDVQMPGMDGLEATRNIRAHEAERQSARLPIVALTADAMMGDRERCLAAGMDDYLTKPLRREALARVLQDHAGGARDA